VCGFSRWESNAVVSGTGGQDGWAGRAPLSPKPQPGARRGHGAAGRHASRQDQPDAGDGGPGRGHHRPRAGGRCGRDAHVGAPAQRGHGLPAVCELPVDDGGAEHRLAHAPARRPRRGPEGARHRRASAHRHVPRPPAGRTLGRAAAARGARAGAGQAGAADAVRRTPGEPGLQAARRAARGAHPLPRASPPWSTPPPNRARRCCWVDTPP